MAIEKIVWRDVRAGSGWVKRAAINADPVEVTTVGHVVAESDAAVTVAGSIDGQTLVHSPMVIPKGAIQARTALSEA